MKQYDAAKDALAFQRRMQQICGKSFVDRAFEVTCSHGDIHLSGHVCQHARTTPPVHYIYVNQRFVRDKGLLHALKQIQGTLDEHQVLSYVLRLDVPAHDVDVNVHPARSTPPGTVS